MRIRFFLTNIAALEKLLLDNPLSTRPDIPILKETKQSTGSNDNLSRFPILSCGVEIVSSGASALCSVF